jgi:hypothetical protein
VTIATALSAHSFASAQTPVGTAFTYQGRLTAAGSPANGSYDLRFILYDALVGGAQVIRPATGEHLARTLPRARCRMVAGAGHFSLPIERLPGILAALFEPAATAEASAASSSRARSVLSAGLRPAEGAAR